MYTFLVCNVLKCKCKLLYLLYQWERTVLQKNRTLSLTWTKAYYKHQMLTGCRQSLLSQLGAESSWIKWLLNFYLWGKKYVPHKYQLPLGKFRKWWRTHTPLRNPRAHSAQPRITHTVHKFFSQRDKLNAPTFIQFIANILTNYSSHFNKFYTYKATFTSIVARLTTTETWNTLMLSVRAICHVLLQNSHSANRMVALFCFPRPSCLCKKSDFLGRVEPSTQSNIGVPPRPVP